VSPGSPRAQASPQKPLALRDEGGPGPEGSGTGTRAAARGSGPCKCACRGAALAGRQARSNCHGLTLTPYQPDDDGDSASPIHSSTSSRSSVKSRSAETLNTAAAAAPPSALSMGNITAQTNQPPFEPLPQHLRRQAMNYPSQQRVPESS
jgi:hypothetical protein